MTDPYPLRTERPVRLLAWPRWDDLAELDTLLGTFARLLADRPEATLVLRHDGAQDGDMEASLQLLQGAYAGAFRDDEDIDLLILDDPLSEADLPRVGAAVSGLIVLRSTHEDPVRTVFAETLGARLLQRPEELAELLPSATPPASAALRDTPWATWSARFRALPGTLALPAAAAWDALLAHQSRAGLKGAFVEFGVFQGRSATLAALHLGPSDPLVLVDPNLPEPLTAAVRALKGEQCAFLRAPSSQLPREELFGQLQGAVRWLHVDGGRSGHAVDTDLRLANVLLAEHGVLAVGGFFSPLFPQVTWAVLRYLADHPYTLRPLLVGYGQLLLCRPDHHRAYMSFIRDHLADALAARDVAGVHLTKTSAAADLNAFGLGPDADLTASPELQGVSVEI